MSGRRSKWEWNMKGLLYHRDQMYRVGGSIGRGVGEEISGGRNTTMKLQERGQPQDTLKTLSLYRGP